MCFEHRETVQAFLKPLVRYFTTIDFGQLTFESDVDRILDQAKVCTVVRAI